MTILKHTLAAALMAAVSCASLQAHAGLFDDDEARRAILDIRNKIDGNQRDLVGRLEGKADKSSMLELSNQNEQLRQEISRLQGQIEVLTNEVANAQQRQKDFYVDLDNRLRKVEPQQVTVDGQQASVQQTEQSMYDNALAMFKAGDYKGAGASFSEFMRRYPESAYAPSAQYWIGNAYYAQRDFKNAIAAQQVVIKNYRNSPKAPDAMLNIATSYMELKDKPAAKKTLESLVSQYPGAPAAQTARERLTLLK